MALNPSNSSNLEHLVLKGLNNNLSIHIVLHLAGTKLYCGSLTKQYNLVPVKAGGVISLARKVTMGLVESNGSLPPGL